MELAEDELKYPAYNWEDDAEQQGGPESIDMEAADDVAGEYDDQGVDDKKEQAKSEYGHRNGDKLKDRLNEKVEQC